MKAIIASNGTLKTSAVTYLCRPTSLCPIMKKINIALSVVQCGWDLMMENAWEIYAEGGRVSMWKYKLCTDCGSLEARNTTVLMYSPTWEPSTRSTIWKPYLHTGHWSLSSISLLFQFLLLSLRRFHNKPIVYAVVTSYFKVTLFFDSNSTCKENIYSNTKSYTRHVCIQILFSMKKKVNTLKLSDIIE